MAAATSMVSPQSIIRQQRLKKSGFRHQRIFDMDATAQAELVRRKELTPLELGDAAIARIERVNLTLNAMIILSSARARERYGSVLTICITIRPGLRVSWKWRKS
jgi:hypothetical protein